MTKPPRHSTIGWIASIVALVVVDIWQDRKHNATTLSENTRYLCKTDTKAGRVFFTTAWGGFALWMIKHILNGPVGESLGLDNAQTVV